MNKVIVKRFSFAFVLAIFALFFVQLFLLVLYPVKYSSVISDCANQYDIREQLIYSVINVESSFKKDAKSSRGAVGLMQLMPETAEYVWEDILDNDTAFSEDLLTVAAYNIHLGCAYLRYLSEKFPDEKQMLAAYNAGEGNVSRWLKDDRYSKDGSLTEIPFTETANYIKKINRNLQVYSWRIIKDRN